MRSCVAPVGSSKFLRSHQIIGGWSHLFRSLRRPAWFLHRAAVSGSSHQAPLRGSNNGSGAASSRQPVNRRRIVTTEQIKDSRRAWFFHRRWAVPGFGVNFAPAIVIGPGAGNRLGREVGVDNTEKTAKVLYPSRPGAAPGSKSYSGCRLHQPVQRAGTLTSGCRRPSFALPFASLRANALGRRLNRHVGLPIND